MHRSASLFGAGLLTAFLVQSMSAGTATSVTSNGITWTFDRPCEVGHFVTGDPWVVGPVTVISVDPGPGASLAEGQGGEAKSRYGAVALVDDRRMRNGSMVLPSLAEAGGDPRALYGKQGYDSRPKNYDPSLSIAYPYRLDAGRSLISTISEEALNEKGVLATPHILAETKMFLMPKTLQLALRSASILTCVVAVPPDDAFRPAYVGKPSKYYQVSSLKREALPRLVAVGPVPDWAAMERQFERPWLDHIGSWLVQNTAPGLNQPNYGREFARLSSIATTMLMLDVPDERKEKLLVGYVQLGIDLAGLAQNGRQWFSDGGHWQGRKWPILFASLMLDAPELRDFPKVDLKYPVYGRCMVLPSEATPAPTTLFQEDLDTYYGKGGDGQTALWQIVYHTGPKPPHEQIPRAEFDKNIQFLEAYRFNNAGSGIGVALAAQMMKAKSIWNHDAFFDYMDRWMGPDEKWDNPKWLRAGMTRSVDPFVEAMWYAHRPAVPAQPGGKDHLKWVWGEKMFEGTFIANPPGSE